MAWDCLNCGEDQEETFDACWKCGTSRSGVPDPDFEKRSQVITSSDPDADLVLDFTCDKCGLQHARVEWLWMERRGLNLIRSGELQFTVLSCEACGFSEVYRR